MKVLVTGASGFLGSHVAEQLCAQGHRVRALVRATSKVDFLKTLDGLEFAYGAIEDRASLDEAMQGIEAVIHSAALVKARNAEEFKRINVDGTRYLLEAVKALGTPFKRFVFVSSLAAVGPSQDGTPVDATAANPVTHYGRSKLAAERVVLQAAGEVRSVILRPPMIYGPRDQEALAFFKAVSNRVLPFFGDGSSTMNVVYGADAATACIKALDAEVPSGAAYFVHDGRIYVWKQMLEEVERVVGKRALLRFGLPFPVVHVVALFSEAFGKLTGQAVMMTRDKLNELKAPHWVSDSSDTRRDLNWSPETDWAAGIRLSLEWYRQAGWL